MFVMSSDTESILASLKTEVIPRVGELIKLGDSKFMKVRTVAYSFGSGDNVLTYVNVVVEPVEAKR